MNQIPFTIVIQAGGESRRMGRDKALIPFLGDPLINRIIHRVENLADEILVTTNQPENYQFVNLPLVPDRFPGRGALGGLFTALEASQNSLVGVIACDMPFVNADLLALARDILVSTNFAAVIPHTVKGNEPFHAVYRRELCLPAITRALEGSRWRVDSWFSEVDIRYLSIEEIRTCDQDGLAFFNINTPEEITRAEELALNEIR